MNEVHILTSRILGQQRQLNMIADNIANLNTTGYKKMDIQFQEVLSREYGQKVASYVEDRGLTINYEAGPLKDTGNPFDMAIIGEGFFAVTVDGKTEYTRNGHFLTTPNGILVDSRGNTLQDSSGSEITIPPTATDVTITRDGSIATDQGILTTVGLFVFSKEDEGKLQRTGFGGFTPVLGATARPAPPTTTVIQNNLESSNVNGAKEVITMQDLSRSYQSAQKLMGKIEELESKAIQKLGGGGR